MEISQNFGGEYFYPLNPKLSGYELGTSGFTAVLGKLQRIQTILRIEQNISKVLIEFDF